LPQKLIQVQDNTGLDARDAAMGIDFEDPRHVPGEVEDDGGIATLSGERGATAAGKQWSVMIAAKCNSSDHVFFIAREDDTDRDLTVLGAVSLVESAAARVEADIAAEVET